MIMHSDKVMGTVLYQVSYEMGTRDFRRGCKVKVSGYAKHETRLQIDSGLFHIPH